MSKVVVSVVLSVCFAWMLAAEEVEPFRKKAIACSWDLGNFSFADILSNRAAFAAMPFSGARLYPNGAKGPDGKPVDLNSPMTSEWPQGVLRPLLADLREVTAMRPFRHSFLGFTISTGPKSRLDFRDDAVWGRFFGNVRQLAELARDGGCEGVLMDPEDYGKGRQFYRIDGDPELEELLKLARRRGREFSAAIYGTFPKATIFSFWLWSARRGYLVEPGGVSAAVRRHGDLWYAFLDGMLDGISPEGRMVDGDEYSYNYSPFNDTRFTYTDCQDKNRACIAGVSPENRMKFRAHVLMGSAVYLDRYTNPEGSFYYSAPLSGSRLLHFDENFSAALHASDEYVWFWAEKHAWIDWKTHGPARNGIAFTEHQTWDDVLPGVYDAIFAQLDSERFLRERFPQLKGRTTCTNLVKTGTWKVTGKMAYGRYTSAKDIRRAERYVLTSRATGDKPKMSTTFHGAKGRFWGMETRWAEGTGELSYLVKVLPSVTSFNLGCSTGGGTNGVAEFSDIGIYRLPTEDGYYERGDWSAKVGNRCFWFTLDGGEEASEHTILWGGSSPVSAKVTRDGAGRVTMESSYSHPDHPDWAWTRRFSFVPTGGDEMACEFFETRANRPGKDVRETGVAKRMPLMGKRPDLSKLVYGEPIDLLKDGLDGWEPMGGRKSEWVFKKGVLENRGSGANIRTKRADFTDFKLSYDVRVDTNCNSGVYLRGLYEIQTIDSYGKAPDSHNMGAVYGRITPRCTADRKPGVWQHVDVTLCERHVTVWLNGECIIRNKPVRGFTGGALSTDVLAPGPMYIQGDHKGGAYRNMKLRPIVGTKDAKKGK